MFELVASIEKVGDVLPELSSWLLLERLMF